MRNITKLFLLISIVLSPMIPALARTFDVALTGQELLCQLVPTGPTQTPPGIYAIDPVARNIRCIIPYGMRPTWSPDHTKIAYWDGGDLCIADRTTKRIGPYYSVYMASAVSHVDMEYYWSPDSKSIIAFSALKLPTPSITPERHVLERYALPVSLWRRTVSEQVGRMSFASDGSYAAYEVVETIPSIGKVPKHICIGKIGEQEKVPLQLPDAFPAAHSFNPLWQPGRSTVAFEVRQANTNLGYLWDMKTMTITQIPAYDHLSHGITWNTRLINWSPDGTYLLLEQNMAEADVLSVGSLYAVPFGNDAKPIRFFERPGHLQTAQWSPDGKMLAIHRATNLDPMVASYRNFSIYTVADQTIAWTISDDRRLRGLVPVWMSW